MCASALIINLDNTILNVALPTLVRQLHATSTDLQWIVDSYAMVFAGLLLVAGSLADRFGRRRFFLRRTLGLRRGVDRGRLLRFGADADRLPGRHGRRRGADVPSSLSIINDVFSDPVGRARAIGAWGGTIGLGIAIGPIEGGLLLAHFWWGSIFMVNVPIAVVAFLAAIVFVPDSKKPSADEADPAGALLSMAGLGLLLWTIIEAPLTGWTSAPVIGVGCASIGTLAVFVLFEARSRHPMVDLGLFSDRRFSSPRPPSAWAPSDCSGPCSFRPRCCSSTSATRRSGPG